MRAALHLNLTAIVMEAEPDAMPRSMASPTPMPAWMKNVGRVVLHADLQAERAGKRIDDPVARGVGCADAEQEVDGEPDDIHRGADVERKVVDGAGAERDRGQVEVVGDGELAVGEIDVQAGGGGAPGSCEPMAPATSLSAVRNLVTGSRIPLKTRSSLGNAGGVSESAWKEPCSSSSGSPWMPGW